jgi:hypothetical protein
MSTKYNHNCPGVQGLISLSFFYGFSDVSKQLSAVTALRDVATLMRGVQRRGVPTAVVPTAKLDQTFDCPYNRPLIVSVSADRTLQQVTYQLSDQTV